MKDVGIVVKDAGKFVSVKVDKKDECSKCGMCLFPKNASSIEFNVKNTLGAKVGDEVIIESESGAKLVGASLAFLVPLVLILISAVITFTFIKEDIYMLILSVGSIVIWYLILPLIDKRLKKTNAVSPKMIKIIEKISEETKEI